jgi:cytochrome c5
MMLILNRSLLLSVVISLPLYAQNNEPVGEAAMADGESTPSWREERLALGKETYERVCASCHDSGAQGAPRIGVPEDWSDRSDMWEAVLMPHARAGYLEMPGKGGHPELSDKEVDAAAEYMLGRTLPELPRD